MKSFKFCPQCGSDQLYRIKPFVLDCPKCKFQLFINPAAAVAGLIKNNNGSLLLVRRARDPELGKLDLPGGFVDVGESAEDALLREIKEELNLDVTACQFIKSRSNEYRYNGVTYYPLDLFFECTVKSFDNIILQDEVSDYYFIPIQQLDINLVGFDSVKSVLSWYKDQTLN
jgi:NAD+ diphosphatase